MSGKHKNAWQDYDQRRPVFQFSAHHWHLDIGALSIKASLVLLSRSLVKTDWVKSKNPACMWRPAMQSLVDPVGNRANESLPGKRNPMLEAITRLKKKPRHHHTWFTASWSQRFPVLLPLWRIPHTWDRKFVLEAGMITRAAGTGTGYSPLQ